MMRQALLVNGERREVEADPDMPLLWVLRDLLGLTGTKYGCGQGQCGACTVLLDGVATRSCGVPLSAVGTGAVTTIEGLSPDGSHPLQRAWVEHGVAQCGYCQPGMVMAAEGLLRQDPKPDADGIKAAITNLCRCGSQPRMVRAVLAAAGGR